jgi:hypothetical protein
VPASSLIADSIPLVTRAFLHQDSCSMITLTRNQVRRLRVAFRRSALGITNRGMIPPLVLRAEGTQLRAQYRYRDLAIEHVELGS